MIGNPHEQADDTDAAIAKYRRVLTVAPALGPNPVVPGARLKLAQLLVKRGDTTGAKEQLDRLLAQWKSADTEFSFLTETKALRAKIKD
jgi:hypothetical protein